MLAVAEQKRYQKLQLEPDEFRTLSPDRQTVPLTLIRFTPSVWIRFTPLAMLRFLYTVLNGLVMIVNDPEFLMTIKIGFTIGAFYLALQGLMAGKFPAFQHLLLSLLIYSALFGLAYGWQ